MDNEEDKLFLSSNSWPLFYLHGHCHHAVLSGQSSLTLLLPWAELQFSLVDVLLLRADGNRVAKI